MFRHQPLILLLSTALLMGCLQRPPVPPAKYKPPAESAVNEPTMAEMCSPSAGAEYGLLKRVVVVGFGLSDPAQANDLNEIEQRYPSQLTKLLDDEGRFVLTERGHTILVPAALDLMGNYSRTAAEQARQVAEEQGAQFVISGRFLDLSSTYYDNLIDTARKWPVRQLVVEIEVFDGYSGSLITRHLYRDRVKGRIDMKQITPFDGRFNESEYGQAVAHMLKLQVRDIVNDLACMPMQARILKLDGNTVYIDAGANVLLRPNDELKIFRKRIAAHDLHDKMVAEEIPYGTLTIKRLFPNSSIGTLKLKRGRAEDLRPGDIVRAW